MGEAAEILGALTARERGLVERLAAASDASPAEMLAAIVQGWLRLAEDAPEALPPDPMKDLAARLRPLRARMTRGAA